ncbi:chromosome segregation protein SMC [Hallerella porci]|uniref:Chromosome partition protein Smc n=1 Tax=Hallerella porci TaxID=1945871 RepID=A0ABX5LLP6_9BACT|nr:chromosome segregation protein SMC [Hallerella porci]PWL03341.1 condensin subunit Smc [Hallerella porci]
MKITKLKIFGFKSFAQRTEITFPGNGLTAVVGPNGAGKSNIVDSIRWVLGEQRASVLRMDKMQSVIFSGTEERAAMSIAEVSLVIDNSNGDLASEYSEVMVTRRAHRDGLTEYLINNQECRLKDIQNLFFDSGLGSGNYSQMNETMIRNVLADSPEYRRTLFEEAAGVSKYKKQRKETISQLDRVRADMERVEDNLRHERATVRQYEKQAEKANEWKRLRSRLRELDLSVSLDRHEDNRKNLAVLNDAKTRVSHEQESDKTRLSELEAKIAERQLVIAGDEENLRGLENEVKKQELELNDLNNEIARNREMQGNAEMNRQKYRDEIVDAERRIGLLKEERTKLEEETQALGSEDALSEKQLELAREEEALQVLRDDVDDLREESRTLSDKRIACINKANNLRSRWQREDAESEMLRANVQKWQADITDLENKKSESNETLASIATGIEDAQREIENLQERKSVQEEEIENLAAALSAEDEKIVQAKSRKAALESRIEVLENMNSDAGSGVDYLLNSRASEVKGLLGSLITVDPQYANAVEFALGRSLNAVVADASQLDSLLGALDSASAGNAMIAFANGNSAVAEFPLRPGVIGVASKFVKADSAILPIVEKLLARSILVENFAVAKSLAQEFAAEDYWFLSLDGRYVSSSGLVLGGRGKSEAPGVLARKAEVEKDLEELENLKAEIERLADGRERLNERLEESRAMLSETGESIREAEEQIRSGNAAEKIHRGMLTDLERRMANLETSLRDAESKIEKFSAERSDDAELAKAEEESKSIEDEYAKVMDTLTEKDQIYKDKEDDVREMRNQLGSAQSTLQNNLHRIASIAEQVRLFEDIIAGRNREIEKIDLQKEELSKKENEIAEKVQSKDEELRKKEEERDVARERYNVVAGDVNDWRSEVRDINSKLLNRSNDINDLTLRINALGTNIDRMKERIFAEWEVDIDHAEDVTRVEYEEKEAKKEISELRSQIKSLGPVNVDIMEDFDAEKARLAEVEKQFDDLDQARASLERTIAKLDGIARDRFLETFRNIQKNFQDVFSRIMINGEAKLSLQDGVDPLEAAIEVNARPTGKKMRGVTALSGGERALTAVSLLFAIYMEKPSPYCVLDEVDGPLDDANIGRFMELLRHFSNQTQFILVTHNKRTMAAADMLYGVTQEIKGISRIASVKLDDAVALELHKQ